MRDLGDLRYQATMSHARVGEDADAMANTSAEAPALDDLVLALRHSREVTHNIRHRGRLRRTPSREALARILEDLTAALFPSHFGQFDFDAETIDGFVRETLDQSLRSLAEQVRRGLSFSENNDKSDDELQKVARDLTRTFASALPELRATLVGDLRAAFDGDPAATSLPEILIGYPGMTAIIHHRMAHKLHRLGATLPGRLIAAIAHSRTGIDIHPAASIGDSFFIDHGTGVVIGETTVIGDNVRLYQAVTLGARNFQTDATGQIIKGGPRHPVLEDDVTIYAGATVLGRVTIGRGSTIGGNVWLTESVPPGCRITQASPRGSFP